MSRVVLSLASLLFLAACAQQPSNASDTMASSSEAFDLSATEINNLKAQAEKGSDAAAYRLGEYYAFVKSDRQEAIRWYQIPANAGNVSAMNALSLHYTGLNTEAACAQATEWLDKAIAQAPEKYVVDGYLRERRKRLRWDGENCKH